MAKRSATGDSPIETVTHNLPDLARMGLGKKPAWSRQSEDLSINLISCTAGQGVGSHMNSEVDVLLVGIEGEGSVEIDGHWHGIQPGLLLIIPKGTQRATRCDGNDFAYLTCHRRRAGLWPTDHRDGNAIPQGGQS